MSYVKQSVARSKNRYLDCLWKEKKNSIVLRYLQESTTRAITLASLNHPRRESSQSKYGELKEKPKKFPLWFMALNSHFCGLGYHYGFLSLRFQVSSYHGLVQILFSNPHRRG